MVISVMMFVVLRNFGLNDSQHIENSLHFLLNLSTVTCPLQPKLCTVLDRKSEVKACSHVKLRAHLH